MTTAGIIVLVGVILSVAVACVGYRDKSESKTDHALTWFTVGGGLAIVLRIYIVFYQQHLSWWGWYFPYDCLQGVPVAIYVAYLWDEPFLFPGGWKLAAFTLSVAFVIAIVLVFGGLVIWPLWLFFWGAHWLLHKFV